MTLFSFLSNISENKRDTKKMLITDFVGYEMSYKSVEWHFPVFLVFSEIFDETQTDLARFDKKNSLMSLSRYLLYATD